MSSNGIRFAVDGSTTTILGDGRTSTLGFLVSAEHAGPTDRVIVRGVWAVKS